MKGKARSLPMSYRLAVTSRVLAAVLGVHRRRARQRQPQFMGAHGPCRRGGHWHVDLVPGLPWGGDLVFCLPHGAASLARAGVAMRDSGGGVGAGVLDGSHMKEGFRQAMAWLHTWAGLIFGWLLFAIFLTGTLAYFKDETSHWMKPEIPARSVSSEVSLNVAQNYLEQHAGGASRWLIELPTAREPGLSVRWQQTPTQRGERGQFTEKHLDPQTGAEVQGRESTGGEFFYRFHFQLQMPYPWGRWLSTFAAMVMFVALISGIITHKKIFKDFFTFRPRKGQRTWLDGHNAVGVLVLPFHLMITYSSLVIFMVMVMPASILVSYKGDVRGFYDELFPASTTPQLSGQPAALAPLAPLLEKAREQWGDGRVARLTVNNPGTRVPRLFSSETVRIGWFMTLAAR